MQGSVQAWPQNRGRAQLDLHGTWTRPRKQRLQLPSTYKNEEGHELYATTNPWPDYSAGKFSSSLIGLN